MLTLFLSPLLIQSSPISSKCFKRSWFLMRAWVVEADLHHFSSFPHLLSECDQCSWVPNYCMMCVCPGHISVCFLPHENACLWPREALCLYKSSHTSKMQQTLDTCFFHKVLRYQNNGKQTKTPGRQTSCKNSCIALTTQCTDRHS